MSGCSDDDDVTVGVQSLDDLVVLADAVVAVTVTDEREAGRLVDGNPPEGVIGREITISVDQVLWVRPESKTVPATFAIGDPGWRLKDGTRRVAGSPPIHLTPGEHYVLAVATDWSALPKTRGVWGQVHPDAEWNIEAGQLTTTCDQGVAAAVDATRRGGRGTHGPAAVAAHP